MCHYRIWQIPTDTLELHLYTFLGSKPFLNMASSKVFPQIFSFTNFVHNQLLLFLPGSER